MCDVACGMELKVPSDMVYLRPVRAFVRELAENVGFCHERANDIELAVDEVFANAIEHGSDSTGSPVLIRCLTADDMIKVIVSDKGREGNSKEKWLNAWTDAVSGKTESGTERGHGLSLAHDLADEMNMETNQTGGLDVHLVVYKERQSIKNR